MEQYQLLVIEDDYDIANLLEKILEKSGYDIIQSGHGNEGYQLYQKHQPDMVILDLGLPGIDGIEICKKIREDNLDIPIIMLTARDSSAEQVQGLDVGADDYITKPFRREELLARVRAQLRKVKKVVNIKEDEIIERKKVGDLELDEKQQVFYRGDRMLQLTKGEFKMLLFLFNRPGELISREELLKEVWGYQALEQETNTIDMFVYNLRKKLEEEGEKRIIATRHGRGYTLKT